jgi:hypothetical protein
VLYCSADQDSLGSQIDTTITNSEGWYELTASASCAYYNIFEQFLDGYGPMGASTVDGIVRNTSWIQFEGPLTDKNLTGNKFWQAPGSNPFSGHVYNGLVGETDAPLSGANLHLYCSQSITSQGDVVDQTTTDASGWYTLWGPMDCKYYTIIEHDPQDFVSVGASSVDGTVNNPHNISFSAPLTGQDLSGNRFWDKPAALPFSGRVFIGYPQDESHPFSFVNIILFCSQSMTSIDEIVSTAITDTDGWFEVRGYEGCPYYWIYQLDHDGYISTGASTVDGEMIDHHLIRFQSPYAGLDLTGNRFWDMPASGTFLPLIIH